jgi:hypothetical protein
MDAVAPVLARVGAWTAKWPFWTVFVGATLVMMVKTGFRWAGTTGEGWFIEFRPVIDSWPLKESFADVGDTAWQENYSSILAFRGLTRIGFPYSSATWMLVHMAASIAVMAVIGLWVRRTYGDDLGRLVALIVVFGAAPMILLHEIGRYDSFFFLGGVLLATGRRWWTLVIGALLVGTSSWSMGIGLCGGLVLAGLVLGSRSLAGRGALGLLGCVAAIGFLMGLRAWQGGDPWLVRLGNLSTGGGSRNLVNMVYQGWLNVVQPFPNWIYAAFGITWILFVLVVLQASRRRVLLAVSMVILPVLAGAVNAGDGTREIALSLAAILFAVATTLEMRSRAPGAERLRMGPSHVVLGLVVLVCIVAPVVNINPNAPLNPYGWLSDYGLSAVHSILG